MAINSSRKCKPKHMNKTSDTLSIVMLIPSLNGGGAERVFVNLANFFAKKGHKVWLLTSDRGIYFDHLIPAVNLVRIKNLNNFEVKGKVGAIRNIFTFSYKVYRELKGIKVDVLLCTLNIANIAGFFIRCFTLKKIKFVARQATVVSSKNSSFIMRYLLKSAFLKADVIIANSYDTAASIETLVKKQKHFGKIQTLGNPVFDSSIRLLAKPVSKKLIGKKYLLTVGRLWKVKDQATLIRAFAIVRKTKDVRLVILGEGPLEIALKQLAEQLQISNYIDFKGFVDNPYSYYANAELFVLSSIFEGFGNVLVEALSFGLPIVSTNCLGGPKFILDNGKYGDLVPVGDAEMMAERIIYRLNHIEEVDRSKLMGRADMFSIEMVGEAYLETIIDRI